MHCQIDQQLEEEILSVGPTVFFAHAYAGTCISGGKTLHDPIARPCDRTFGTGCLLHYYPHRCGGLNPRTMFRNFARNRAQLKTLEHYAAIITFSSHMYEEYLKHGLVTSRLKLVPPFSPGEGSASPTSASKDITRPSRLLFASNPLRLGFLGRLEPQKGTHLLIEALPRATKTLDRGLHLIIVGAGRVRSDLAQLAATIMHADSRITVEFRDWISTNALDAFYSGIHLLVVPSVWPEPFGLVGLEAAERGVPAVAFAVGGIPDWLEDAKNGHLAAANPPTSDSLAAAIIECLADPAHHARLRDGAFEVASRFSAARHMENLIAVLGTAARSPGHPRVTHPELNRSGDC